MFHRNPSAVLGLLFCLMCVPACAHLATPDGPLRLEVAYPDVSFVRPVDFQVPADGSNRIFVAEQAGVIRVLENRSDVAEAKVFLDIRDRVRHEDLEEGLLGLAFHPEFESNGTFFVDYTASDPRRTVIARYRVDPNDVDKALHESEEILLEVEQPYGNHNGGQIVFGPDGFLYIALGDGGKGGDPENNAQDRSTLLGSILRIDVNQGRPYAIPKDNPFVKNEQGFREEIYAYGLRNPWRMSFDPETDRLWAGDVGQRTYEEVDIITKGGNYGWKIMEGFNCFNSEAGCDGTGLIPPIWEYDHNLGSSITGGYVYRGKDASSIVGKYIYADYVSGRIWGLTYEDGKAENQELLDTYVAITSFGLDQNKELYVLAFDGMIYRLTTRPERPQSVAHN